MKEQKIDLKTFASEIKYWDDELSLKGAYPQAIVNRSTPRLMQREYPGLFEKYRFLVGKSANILDVGSGPLSMLAYGHYKKLYKLQCVDPLGDVYLDLLKKYKFKVSYEITACPGEKLSTLLPNNFYDIVWIHNALDHSQEPPKVMEEMVKVLKSGGYLCIAGWAREGEAEGYLGLHQNNLYLENGRLWLSFKNGDAQQIDNIPELSVVEYMMENNTREWFHIVYRKI
jgi:SAM-dependent methyltransferase